MKNEYLLGLVGTGVGAVGTSLSVTEVQAIVSIIVTVLGFLISVVIPYAIKIILKIKKAKQDGVITKEEIDDITSDLQEGAKKTEEFIEKNKKEGD